VAESPRTDRRPLRLRLGAVTFPLDIDKLVIGRSRSCDIRLREDTVSRLHAALVWRDDGLVVEDLGSSNGTFVNGERVLSPRTVVAGDSVRFGSLRGTLETSEATHAGAEDGPDYTVGVLPGEPAGFGWRLLAMFTDVVLFAAGSFVPFGPLLATLLVERYVLSPEALPPTAEIKSIMGGGCAVLWVVFAFYYIIHGWARRGGTPGLRLCGLRLVDYRQRLPIGYPRAVLRLVALLVTVLTLGSGYLLIPFRRDRKALHDLLAGTLVIHRTAPLGRPTPSA
jgi:uncharacterized RDD family membrane protein YckC